MGGVQIKTAEQVKAMRKAGLLTGRILEAMGERIAPGVTTLELDALARELWPTRVRRPVSSTTAPAGVFRPIRGWLVFR